MTTEETVNRTAKLKELRSLGINPYPNAFVPDHATEELQKEYEGHDVGDSAAAEAGSTPFVKVGGRMMLFRSMGKNAFGQIQDASGRIQVMFNKDATGFEGYEQKNPNDPSPYKLIEKKCDLGDWIGVEGHLFRTQKGELTIFVKKMTMLCKSLYPLPDKHAGLADKETRYRKRWLDLISNPEVKNTFVMRSRIIKMIRDYFEERRFLEVETPVLQSIYGGADAKPFITELNALNQEMFMRISLEPPLKKLIVGGMGRIFEIGKVFRNEGIDRSHNPEFTLLEAYASFFDYNDMMELVENLYEQIAIKLFGKPEIVAKHPTTHEEITINLKAPWKRLTMMEAIETLGDKKINGKSDEELKKLLLDSGHIEPDKLKTMSRGLLIAAFFEIFAEPHLIQPHHIIDHPIETTPFCKRHRDPELRDLGFVERFESFILGCEMVNAYTELNDPELQKELLMEQAKRRDTGDEEAAPYDEDFIEAIGQGMPPCGGIGIGIDRLVMLFTEAVSIRDVLYFPWMK